MLRLTIKECEKVKDKKNNVSALFMAVGKGYKKQEEVLGVWLEVEDTEQWTLTLN